MNKRKINQEILRLALPNILSNISVPLLSSVDTSLMGHLSSAHLGAVGISSMIFNFIYWNFGFLRMGTTGISAQAYGKKSKEEMSLTLIRALIIALFISTLLIFFRRPLLDAGVSLMQVNSSQVSLVATYFNIRILAAPASLGSYVFFGWLFGLQNAVYPLIVTLLVNTINILCSYYFVVSMGWEISGVAWGTVIAQYIGLLFLMILTYQKYKEVLYAVRLVLLKQWSAFLNFLKINLDIFIRTVCLTFAFAFFYSESSQLGGLILASNVILLQFVNWMSYAIDGYAYAAESLTGKFKGARDESSLNTSIRYLFLWSFAFAVFFSFLYGIAGDLLVRLFSDEIDVVLHTKKLIWLMVLFPVIAFSSYIWDGIFIGLTASKAMRNSMILSLIIFMTAYYFWLIDHGNIGLWLAFLSFLLSRATIQTIFYWKKGNRLT